MNRKDKSLELTIDLIERAVQGDPSALEDILKYYDPYITALSTYETIDEQGRIHKEVDEDIKVQIQYKLTEAIKKWQVIL